MFHLHLRSRHALLLGLLSLGVALVACQPADTATAIPTTAPATAAVATPAVLAATAVPPSATPPPTAAPPTATVTMQPTPIPASPMPTLTFPILLPTVPPPPSFRTADRLPADQPWLLVDDGPHVCSASASDYGLIAIDQVGGWTRLNRRITAIAERSGAPPLLATCAADGMVAIVDPIDWTSVRLALGSGIGVSQFVVSPDRKQAILQIWCFQNNQCPTSLPAWMQIMDLQTGLTRPFAGFPVTAPVSSGPNANDVSVRLLGWGLSGLYYIFSLNYRMPITTLDLIDPANPQAHALMLTQDNFPQVLDSANDRLIRMPGNTSLILSNLRHGTTQTIEQAAWLSKPAFAPDGTALAYFRADQDIYNSLPVPQVEFVIFDIARNTKTVLTDTLGFPITLTGDAYMNKTILWSQDSQRIITASQLVQGMLQAVMLTRDGMLLNTVPLPVNEVGYSSALEITGDDQLVLAFGDGNSISWLPLRVGAAPYAPNVKMGGPINAIILPAA